MKKLNEKTISRLLIVSVIINVLVIGYVVNRKIRMYKEREAKIKIVANLQPDKVVYYLKRNEVFEKLPKTANEIIMVGTSLTHNFEWHEMFRDVDIINRGITGEITKGVLQRLNEITGRKPLKIFIEVGINDISKGFQLDAVYDNYSKIIQTIKQKCPLTRVYIQSVLPCRYEWNDIITGFNQHIKDLCLRNGLTYIDLYSKFVSGQKLNPEYDCGDNVHLSGNGYILWCSLIRPYIYE